MNYIEIAKACVGAPLPDIAGIIRSAVEGECNRVIPMAFGAGFGAGESGMFASVLQAWKACESVQTTRVAMGRPQ